MMHLKKWILNIIRSGQLRYLHNKVLFFQKPLFVIALQKNKNHYERSKHKDPAFYPDVAGPSRDREVLAVLAEDVEADPGRVEVVGVTGVVARLVASHAPDAEGGAGGGGRVLDLDHTRPRHQLPVVLPHHVLGAHDGGADHALQLQGTVLLHINVRPPEYPHLEISSLTLITMTQLASPWAPPPRAPPSCSAWARCSPGTRRSRRPGRSHTLSDTQ